MNFSTTPIAADHRPCHLEIARQQLPDRLRIRDPDSGVNPARSENSNKHTHHSATGARSRLSAATGGGAGLAADDGGARSQLVPQGRQSGFPGVTGLPHDGHRPNGAGQGAAVLAEPVADSRDARTAGTSA